MTDSQFVVLILVHAVYYISIMCAIAGLGRTIVRAIERSQQRP